MTERSYTVGLPVTITVDEDGTVTYEVDFSEVAEAIEEDESIYVDENGDDLEYTPAVREEDAARVQAWVNTLYGN